MAIKWEVLSASTRNGVQVPTLLKADVGAFELRLSTDRHGSQWGNPDRWRLSPTGSDFYTDSVEVAKIEAEECFAAALRTALRIVELPAARLAANTETNDGTPAEAWELALKTATENVDRAKASLRYVEDVRECLAEIIAENAPAE